MAGIAASAKAADANQRKHTRQAVLDEHDGARAEGSEDAARTDENAGQSSMKAKESTWVSVRSVGAHRASEAQSRTDELLRRTKAFALREAAAGRASREEEARMAEEERRRAEEEARRVAHDANEDALREELGHLKDHAAEEMEKESILKRYEKHSYLGMKRHLKKQRIPPDRVDECLGKYELKKLADEHAIELPDDVKQYK